MVSPCQRILLRIKRGKTMNTSINVYRFQKVLNELMKQNTKTHTVFITLIYLKFGEKNKRL